MMDWMDRLNAFHFNDDYVFDDQINSVSKFDLLSVVNDRKTDLATHFESAFSKLMSKTSLVSALQQSRP